MARQSIGSFTVTELADGTSPISAFLSNESHTFAANHAGSVSPAEFRAFTTTLNVFLGDVAIPFSTTDADGNDVTGDGGMVNGTFRLSDGADSVAGGLTTAGTGFPEATHYMTAPETTPGVSLRIYAADTAPGLAGNSSANSGSLTINIRVKTNNGTVRPFFLVVGYVKQIEGSDGNSIQLEPTKQFFLADGGGTFDPEMQDDAIVNIYTQGLPGTLQYFIGQNGGSFLPITSTSDEEGGIKGFDDDRGGSIQVSTYSSQVSITNATGLVSGDTVTLTVSVGAGTIPTVTDHVVILPATFSVGTIIQAWADELRMPAINVDVTGEDSTGFTLTSIYPIIISSSTDNIGASFQVTNSDGTIPTKIPNAQRLFISTNNIGNNDSISLKVMGASDDQGTATVSFTKVRKGFRGAASIDVIIESTDGDTFIEGTAGTKTLSVVVYDQGTGARITSGITYRWFYENVEGNSPVQVTSATDRVVVTTGTSASGSEFKDIIIDNNDITGDRTTFVCLVEVA